MDDVHFSSAEMRRDASELRRFLRQEDKARRRARRAQIRGILDEESSDDGVTSEDALDNTFAEKEQLDAICAQGLSPLRGSPRNDCCKPPEKHRLLVPSNLAQHGWPAAVSFRRLLQIARTGPGLNRAGRASAGRLQVGRPEKPRSCAARLRSGSVVRTVPANGLVVQPHPRPLRGIQSTTGEGVAAESWSAGIA